MPLHPRAMILYPQIAGRAAAPICSVHSRNNPSFAIPWQSYKQTIDRFYKDFELYPNLASYNNKAAPYSLFIKTNIVTRTGW